MSESRDESNSRRQQQCKKVLQRSIELSLSLIEIRRTLLRQVAKYLTPVSAQIDRCLMVIMGQEDRGVFRRCFTDRHECLG